MEKLFYANGKQKKAGIAILISDKIELKIKKIKRDKEAHYITINRSIQEKDIIILNINVWQKPIQYCKVISLQLK